MIDKGQIRRNLLLRQMESPWVLVPFMLGAASLTTGLTFDWRMSALALFGGIAGLLTAGGIFLTRLLLQDEEQVTRIIQEMEEEEMVRKERELDALERELETSDDDPRPEKTLRDLRSLVEAFRESTRTARSHHLSTVIDIHGRVIELFDHSVELLGQTIHLWKTADSLNTEAARKPMLERREEIIVEIEGSVQQLSHALVRLKELEAGHAAGDRLRQMREELDQSLTVARAVENRVSNWMQEARSRSPQ